MMPAASAAAYPQPIARIERVLFPTDFSPCAQAAFPYACVLAEQNHATLHLLNIVGSQLPTGPLGVPYMEPSVEEDSARQDLSRLAETPTVKALRHETSVHRGSVWEVVCQIGCNKDDVIVMGTHGRRGVRQLVLGSVAEQVFRRSQCPVMTVGPGASKSGPANGRFATILLALDLSPESIKLVEWAHLFAVQSKSRLIFFHAAQENADVSMAFPTYMDEAIAMAKKRMSALLPKDVPWCDISIKIGDPGEKILETATDRNADLIVIGARRGTTLAAHAPWAVAHEIVCAAPCPVLTVCH